MWILSDAVQYSSPCRDPLTSQPFAPSKVVNPSNLVGYSSRQLIEGEPLNWITKRAACLPGQGWDGEQGQP